MRILVVDDNPHCAWALACVLEVWGHEVRTAQDAPEAITVYTEMVPDAVLLDVSLGAGGSGLDLARSLRALGYLGLIVAVTGHDRSHVLSEAGDSGVDEYLAKPVEMERLQEMMEVASTA